MNFEHIATGPEENKPTQVDADRQSMSVSGTLENSEPLIPEKERAWLESSESLGYRSNAYFSEMYYVGLMSEPRHAIDTQRPVAEEEALLAELNSAYLDKVAYSEILYAMGKNLGDRNKAREQISSAAYFLTKRVQSSEAKLEAARSSESPELVAQLEEGINETKGSLSVYNRCIELMGRGSKE